MKKTIRRIFLLILVFLLALAGFTAYQFLAARETESYEEMKGSTLPLVQLYYSDYFSNELHGYTQAMELASMRDTITPLDREHKLRIVIQHAEKVGEVSYEVRGLDGERLVENGRIEDWKSDGHTMETMLQLSSLVDDRNEYQLVLKLTHQGRDVYYYSRVIYLENGHTESLIGFAESFIRASIDGDTSFIVNYIQPDESMTNDNFAYVNQHSRSGMITWKGLEASIQGEVKATLTELTDSQATIVMNYPISLTSSGVTLPCSVREEYVVRWRNEVLYLLSFDRHVKEDFSYSRLRFDDGNIWLGITDEEPQQMDSPDGKHHVYLYDRQLFAYNEKDRSMELIYTYLDGTDTRGSWDHHTLQMIQVEDTGDVYFMVYGYHNRGNHEGEVGVSFLQYYREERQLNEILFIPVEFSEQVLMENMGTLAYVNQESDLMYLLYGRTVYSIDLSSGEKVEMTAAPSAGSFFTNDTNRLISWEEGNGIYADTIRTVDLSTGQNYVIKAEQGEFLKIQGFLNEDLVYGIGRRSDTLVQAGQASMMPMFSLRFVSFGDAMTASGEYTPAGMYIRSTQILPNALEISRVTKNADGYVAAEDDQVFVNNREGNSDSSLLKTKQMEGFLQVAALYSPADPSKVSFRTGAGKLRNTEAAYRLTFTDEGIESNYYVYAKGCLRQITTELSEAIGLAYREMGCVLDSRNAYIWTRGTRDLNKTLSIEEKKTDGQDSLRVGLEILLAYESAASSSVRELLAGGKTPADVMVAVMTKQNRQGRALSLKGCSVVQILYYLNLNHPVLAVTGDQSAVLLIAYDSRSIVVYDPLTGEKETKSQAEAEEYFARFGNDFICWLE